MPGTFTLAVQEATGLVAVPADIDATAVVMGAASALAARTLSPFYYSASAAVAGVGYGDGVDTLCQVIEQRQGSNTTTTKIPAAIYAMGQSGAAGTVGTPVTSGITGSAAAHVTVTGTPYGTYEIEVEAVGTITVGTGGTFIYSVDGGVTWSNQTNLGTATTYAIPNTNVTIHFGNAADVWNNGDLLTCPTTGGQPSSTDIDNAADDLAAAGTDFALLFMEFDMTAALWTHVTSLITALEAVGKHVTVICRTRAPDFATPESDATWNTSVSTAFLPLSDDRAIVRAAYNLTIDATTTRQYLRASLAQFAADVVRVPRSVWPGAPADKSEANVSLVNAAGALVGHDEGPRGASTGLSNPTLGNRFSCEQRLPVQAVREAVYNTLPWTLYPAGSKIQNLMVRRIANAMKREAINAGVTSLGGKIFYTPADPNTPGSQPMLTPQSSDAVHAALYDVLSVDFADDIQNAGDASTTTGLVQVNPIIVVGAGNAISITVVLAPLVFGYLLNLTIVLTIKS